MKTGKYRDPMEFHIGNSTFLVPPWVILVIHLGGHKIIRQLHVIMFFSSNTKSRLKAPLLFSAHSYLLPTSSQICMFIFIHDVSQFVTWLSKIH